jgi:CBS domain containing-hemolysin-like protein
MTDPFASSPAAIAAANAREPQGRLARLWQKISARWQESSEAEALREAVEELIEAEPSALGAPVAEQALLANILNLRTREVGDCMIPRADIRGADINSSPEELIDVMAKCKHSRIPIYRDTLDDILGMIHIKDVLYVMAEHREIEIHDLMRPVLIVVPSMSASKLLLQMRQTRQHMAMVVDEFGGVESLITIEDLVEEIVGEIEDEHDPVPVPDIVARADGTFLADARLPIEDFEARVDRKLVTPEERQEIDTLGGFVMHVAGHVPKIGEVIKCWAGFEFEILEVDQSRIKRLRVRRTG